MERIYTKGDVEVQNIKVGDITYEYEYGCYIEARVLTEPLYNSETEQWEWQALNLLTNKEIDYGDNPKYSHYSPNLYTYKAYLVGTQI